jgi:hypothetical protein
MWPFIVGYWDCNDNVENCFVFIRCENCVEKKFSKGIGNCPTCKAELKKSGFRYQIFEDPFVELEIDIRKRILKE